jgi:hypothetical protein
MVERKLGRAPLATWMDLAGCRNPFRVKALEELAKHFEHREKDYARAMEITREALQHEDTLVLRKREERLSRRLTPMHADKKK